MTTLLGTSDVVLSHWRPNLSEPVLEQSIGEALRDAAATWREETALVEGHQDIERRRRWTFSSLLDHAEQVARALLGRFSPGEHVAVWAANSPEWVLIEFGAALAGVTLVTVNPAYLDKELTFVLKQSKASGILVQPTYRQRDLLSIVDQVRSELPQLREVIPLSCWSDFFAFRGIAGPATCCPERRRANPVYLRHNRLP